MLATVEDVTTGERQVVEAAYLVGCDGGASTVRTRLGITMSGNPALTYTTNIIFRSPTLKTLHDKGQFYRFIAFDERGMWGTIVAIDGRDRYRVSIVGNDQPRRYSEDEIRDAIRKIVGIDFAFEIVSILPWIRRLLVADSYGTARVFIAGDAAHMFSPTGGFGMNTGIQDAVDLAWKLAAVLEGWGGRHLLQSYEIERRPVGIRNITEAGGNLGRMVMPKADPLVFAGRARRATPPARNSAAATPMRCGANGFRPASISAIATSIRRSWCPTARRNRPTIPRSMWRPRGPAIAPPMSGSPRTAARPSICSAAASC